MFTFNRLGGRNIELTGFSKGYSTEDLTIPSNYRWKRIVSIRERAFVGEGLKKLTINPGLEMIGQGAFKNNHIEELLLGTGQLNATSNAFQGNSVKRLQMSENNRVVYRRRQIWEHLEYLEYKNIKTLYPMDLFVAPRSLKGVYLENCDKLSTAAIKEIEKRNISLYAKKGQHILPEENIRKDQFFEVESYEHYRSIVDFSGKF